MIAASFFVFFFSVVFTDWHNTEKSDMLGARS